MSFTTYAEDLILRHLYRGEALSLPAAWKVALFTADPGEAGSTTGAIDTGVWTNYQDATLTRDTTDVSEPAPAGGGGQECQNAVLVSFGNAIIVGTPPVVTHVGLVDASGNVWKYTPLTTPKTINNGDPVDFPIGTLGLGLN